MTTNPIQNGAAPEQAPESYTVPAMRGAAMHLRNSGAALLADAEIKARRLVEDARRERDKMCASADEIDAAADQIAAQQATRQQPSAERPAMGTVASCPGTDCVVPVVWDGLGWTHAGATDCRVDLSGYVPQPATADAAQESGAEK